MPPTTAENTNANNNQNPQIERSPERIVQGDVQSQSHVTGEINAARSATTLPTAAESYNHYVQNFNQIVDQSTGAVNTDLGGALSQGKLYQVADAGVQLSAAGAHGGSDVPPPSGIGDAGAAAPRQLTDNTNTPPLSSASDKVGTAQAEAQALMTRVNDNPNGQNAYGLDTQQQKLMSDSVQQIMDNSKLSDTQKADILHQANRMFTEQDRIFAQGLNATDRNQAVTGMLYDTANPEAQNQGQHNTCNGTTIGKMETIDHPAQNAQRIADMYTNANGNHTVTMEGGKQIQYDPNALKATAESTYAMTQQGMGGGARDMFVQAMNHLYINDMTQRQVGANGQPAPEFYTQTRSGQFGQQDTGERLLAGSFNGQAIGANGQLGGVPPESSPNINGNDMAAEVARLGESHAFMGSASHFGDMNASNINNINSVDALNNAWDANGGKPMIAAVDTSAGMFHPDSTVGGAGGGHVIVVDGRQQVGTQNGQPVYEYHVANSWGSQYNGWVSGNDLVNAMNPQGSVKSDGQGLQPSPTAGGTTGGGDTALTPPAKGGNAPAGWATYDPARTGVQRTTDTTGSTFNGGSDTAAMNSPNNNNWTANYEQQQQQQQQLKQEEELAMILAQQKAKSQASQGSDGSSGA